MMNLDQVENLVFAGGGVKVVSYAGAIKALEEKNYLKNIKKVAGTSGGAITALCISLGYNAQEIDSLLRELDFTKFADQEEESASWMSKWLPHYVQSAIRFIGAYGLHSGHYVQNFLESLLIKKGLDKNLTFQQLHDSAKTDVDLYVIATNLNTQFPEICSYQMTPNRKVVECVKASGAFPGYFKPVTIDSLTYVDGGVMNNYPIYTFDGVNIVQSHYTRSASIPKHKTLGFKTINQEVHKAYIEGMEPNPYFKIEDVQSHFEAVAEAILNADSMTALINHNRTVFIDDHKVSPLNFHITPEQRQVLIDTGYQATINFIDHNTVSVLGDEQEYMVA